METALIAARALQFGSAMILLGTPLLRLGVGSGFADAAAALGELDRWLRGLMLVAAILALVSALAWLDLEAALMGGGWEQAIDGETIRAVLLETTFGKAWIWHLGFAALLVAALLPAAPAATGGGRVLFLALATGLVAGLAWAGHAVMVPGVTHVGVQILHLLAASLWLGSLPALSYLLHRARSDAGGAWRRALAVILPRYSLAGCLAVAAVVLTGCLNSWFLVGGFAALIGTAFGRVLLAKASLVLLMIAIAASNRFRLTPRVLQMRPEERGAVTALWRNVALEQGLGALVIVAVSVLGTLPPALSP